MTTGNAELIKQLRDAVAGAETIIGALVDGGYMTESGMKGCDYALHVNRATVTVAHNWLARHATGTRKGGDDDQQ